MPSEGGSVGADPVYREVRLIDVLRILHRRKVVVAGIFLFAILGGVAYTAVQAPEYESSATVIALAHPDIMVEWLESRHAAGLVAADLGDSLTSRLFPDRWDDATSSWRGEPPTSEEAAGAVADMISVSKTGEGRILEVTFTYTDPSTTRDVGRAYLRSLDALRPHLENISRQELFDRYFDGSNQADAEQRADLAAKQKTFWLVLDTPSLPESPVRPNPVQNVALAAALGVAAGVGAALFLEWLSKFRAESRPLDLPGPATPPEPPAPERSAVRRFKARE